MGLPTLSIKLSFITHGPKLCTFVLQVDLPPLYVSQAIRFGCLQELDASLLLLPLQLPPFMLEGKLAVQWLLPTLEVAALNKIQQ